MSAFVNIFLRDDFLETALFSQAQVTFHICGNSAE